MKNFTCHAWMLTVFAIVCTGCVQSRYEYGVGAKATLAGPFSPEHNNMVSFGEGYAPVDRLESIVQAPKQFLQKLKTETEDSFIPTAEVDCTESLELAQLYLQENDLSDVFIDVRCYNPKEYWKRLKVNDRIC